ncbi:MAG TPA: c-type cytochrome [Gemmatimonadaceae bacterium]|nr:c-type cytochrome [Gemmatimonadaceae bacterium]
MRPRTKSLLLIAAMIIPAMAFTFGGWAVVTADDVPEYAVAGSAFDLTYTVRQHGQTPRGDLAGSVALSAGGRAMSVKSTALGEGVYRARLNFPQPGTWSVRVNSGWGGVGGEMLPLKVIAANAPVPAPLSPFERGHQLYLAKGCATCHSHAATKDVESVRQGPDLTEPKFAASYLARFLADPSIKKDWKSEARMPNLALKPAEVTALVAFLNQEKRTAAR